MELRALRYFVGIVEEQSYIKAAIRLNVSQSAISQQIKQLEEELGVELIDLHKRKIQRVIELTPQGKMLYNEAKKILQKVNNIENLIRSEKNKNFRLAIYQNIYNQRVIEIHQMLIKEFEGIEIEINEYASPKKVQEAIMKGEAEFGISVLPKINASLYSIPLKDSHLQLVLNKQHPLAQNDIIEVKALMNENWIEITASYHPVFKQVEDFFINIGFNRQAQILQKVSSLDLLCHLVNLGKGIALVPSFFDISAYPNIINKPIIPEIEVFKQILVFKSNRFLKLLPK